METLQALNGPFRIGPRIGAGFALVLAIMLGLLVSSRLSRSDIRNLFGRYSTISSAAKQAGGVATGRGAGNLQRSVGALGEQGTCVGC